ncbi:hypothetical protein DUI87_09195 [Hirundo rustica rustica]|uniref:Uncharacterized protein n=1 Tax=Hirundo rustica rustica TaxID=333673 RepID=A0A3M0KLZ7_HIRRU|nr:hypothetical protein DUI87_09195 [Hirundo rustica rustica]
MPAVPCRAEPCRAELCCAVPSRTVPCRAVPCKVRVDSEPRLGLGSAGNNRGAALLASHQANTRGDGGLAL